MTASTKAHPARTKTAKYRPTMNSPSKPTAPSVPAGRPVPSGRQAPRRARTAQGPGALDAAPGPWLVRDPASGLLGRDGGRVGRLGGPGPTHPSRGRGRRAPARGRGLARRRRGRRLDDRRLDDGLDLVLGGLGDVGSLLLGLV